MKRFHVHLAVPELASSVRFYSALFGTEPAVLKDDYAKWMLDDPRVNFAISARGQTPGLNHLGLQVDSDAELGELQQRADAAGMTGVEEKGAACCYAKSDKYWLQDPQGIAWESFHSLAEIAVFGEAAHADEAACCTPDSAMPPRAASSGCGGSAAKTGCCG